MKQLENIQPALGAVRAFEDDGDVFFAGTVIGQTYGKTMMESCEIGTRLAASVITTGENVCPRYLPSEFGLDASAPDDAQLALEL